MPAMARLREEMEGRAMLYREHGELASHSRELAEQTGKLQQLLQEANTGLEEHAGEGAALGHLEQHSGA